MEHYLNSITYNSGILSQYQDGTASIYSQGAGEQTIWGNTVTPNTGAGHSAIAEYTNDYRDGANYFDGNRWDSIGYQNTASGSTDDLQNNVQCSKYTAPSYIAGNVYTMDIFIDNIRGTRSVKMALYSNAGSLLAQTGVFSVGPSRGTYEAGLTTYPTIAVGTTYILCSFSNGGGNLPVYYATGKSGDQITDTTATWPTPNATLTSSSTGTHLYAFQLNGTCDGTAKVDDPSLSRWPGNNSPASTYRGYPCWRQPARDEAGNLSPIYVWNNYFSDNNALIPGKFFTSNVSVCRDKGVTAPCTPLYDTAHVKAERDLYYAAQNTVQSNSTTPFAGSTGIGIGTLANRPTTCTPTTSTLAADSGKGGVGYWATDQGSWNSSGVTYAVGGSGSYSQGVLYTCTATNTWSVNYTPYNYPHPRVSSTEFLAFTVQPVNTTSGATMTSFTVRACSAAGFPSCSVDTSKTDTISLTVTGCGSVASGTTSHAMSSGVYSFNAVVMTGNATGCTFQVTGTGYASGLSSSFNVAGN
jgi:hypothetical protein